MAPETTNESRRVGHRLATDVGGTFVDFVLLDESDGSITIDKEPSFKDEVARRLFIGYERIVGEDRSLGRMIHGSTLAINTILQETGSRVGLLTTKGFRDVLEIGRGNRTDIYDFFWQPPRPLVPRRLRREVEERIAHDGAVIAPLDIGAVIEEARILLEDEGVESIAICFLHAYANFQHEADARAAILSRWPDAHLTCSHEVATEWREFERTSSVVLNGYVLPVVAGYLEEIECGLAERGFSGSLAVMQSNGGVMAPSVAKNIPIRTLESGPAGGAVGANVLSAVLGLDNLICADVGGTSFDVSLIHEGKRIDRFKTDVDRRPVIAPTVDITSIGAGGGSVIWVDDRGAMRVGPESAGSRPGPACFGLGGERPTVTDCNVLLGRLDPERFLGRRMPLNVELAKAAIEPLADVLELSLEEAAAGALRLAETNMVYATRQITVERGYDPRRFALLGYGGGGGLFAAALARELEIPQVVIPYADAVFSAWGLLFADYREDASMTRVLELDESDDSTFADLVRRLVAQAKKKLAAHDVESERATVMALADVRFKGQEHTLTVPVPGRSRDVPVTAALKRAFVERHRAQYGQADETRPVEITTLRATAISSVSHPALNRVEAVSSNEVESTPREHRGVWFSSSEQIEHTAIWDRERLAPGQIVDGPAIVESWNSTTLVEPDQRLRRDDYGNLIITTSGAA
jgi:N-methylhydantoinase A